MIAVNSTRLNQIWTFYTVVPLALITEPVTHLARVLIVVSILFIACVAVMSLFGKNNTNLLKNDGSALW